MWFRATKTDRLANSGRKEVIKLADFFDKPEEKVDEPKEEEKGQEEAKVKVGEKEYTQEELSKLVGLGEIGAEAEEKFNVRLDKVWPNLQQTINEKKALEDRIKTLEAQPAPEGELTEQQIIAKAKEEAKKLGLVSIDDINEFVDRRIEVRELREDVQAVVTEAEEKYGIKTSEDAILNHMVDTGIKNPQKAFKDIYEEKLDAWKEQQINKVKKPGMVTETAVTGNKEPKTEPVTKDNFFSRIDEVLDRAA